MIVETSPARDAAVRAISAHLAHHGGVALIIDYGHAISAPGGMNAVNLKVAEQYVAAFAGLAKEGTTLIVPSNMADLASLVTSATTMLKAGKSDA